MCQTAQLRETRTLQLRMFWAIALEDGLGHPSSIPPFMPQAVLWLCSQTVA